MKVVFRHAVVCRYVNIFSTIMHWLFHICFLLWSQRTNNLFSLTIQCLLISNPLYIITQSRECSDQRNCSPSLHFPFIQVFVKVTAGMVSGPIDYTRTSDTITQFSECSRWENLWSLLYFPLFWRSWGLCCFGTLIIFVLFVDVLDFCHDVCNEFCWSIFG